MDPGQIRELLDREFADGSFFAFAHPFQGKVVAESVQRERRRQSPKATFGEPPQKSIGFQVKSDPFPVCFTPDLREPCNVVTRVNGVRDGV